MAVRPFRGERTNARHVLQNGRDPECTVFQIAHSPAASHARCSEISHLASLLHHLDVCALPVLVRGLRILRISTVLAHSSYVLCHVSEIIYCVHVMTCDGIL